MAISPQGRSPGEDTRQVPAVEPYRRPEASSGEAIETARYREFEITESAPHEDRAITPPLAARTDPHRGTGEMGTEGLDPSQPLA